MDRTTIAPYKAEEKELSFKLYKKLEYLMVLYPPTDDFRKCFTSDMFIKANQAGFFQVMHYLFRLHDPAEFKKRFYWPITDKRSESTFRSSTVEYLKVLSEKHQLNWNIKSYLVVMPGGMKFITFLLDLIGFIITEQVRVREKQLGVDSSSDQMPDLNLKRMQRQNEFFKDYASAYIIEAERQIANFYCKTQILKNELDIVEISNTNCIINDKFLEEFEQSNSKLFEKKFIQYDLRLKEMEIALTDLNKAMEIFQSKNTETRKDKTILKQALNKIFFGDSALEFKDDISMNSIIAAFVEVYPSINKWLSNIVESDIAANDNVTAELEAMKTELQQLDSQISDFENKYNTLKIKKKDAHQTVLHDENQSLFQYIFTPPIKFNKAEVCNARLALQDDANFPEGCNNLLAITNTVRKKPREHEQDNSFDVNSTLNRSKMRDPAQLLRTIYKDTTKKGLNTQQSQAQQRQNLSVLGQKWKERQRTLFDIEKDVGNTTPILSCQINEQELKVISSPKTPFNTSSGDITRITLTASYERKSSISFKKSTIVKKVQDASINLKNLSTSPSGRLESLVTMDEIAVMSLERKENYVGDDRIGTDLENNANILNTPIKFPIDLNALENDDAIFNTSDTVLKDII